MMQCPECRTGMFGSRKSLKTHRLTHGFVVCECGKKFRQKEHMEDHIRDTNGSCTKKPKSAKRSKYRRGRFQCSVCLRRFPEQYRLSHHQRDTCHKGMNELESDTSEFDYQVASLRCPRSRLSLAGLNISSPRSPDLYSLNKGNLERFIADTVQADSNFLGCCGEVINQLVRKLQDRDYVPKELRPRRIIKSGSLGKGTAVKGRSDIDLILMLVEYDDVDTLLDDLSGNLRKLEWYLLTYTTAKHQRTTRYSVQVEVTCSYGHKHDVDILPAVDLLELGDSPAAVYRKMKGVSANVIHEYSVTLFPLQLEIIASLPPKVKSLIKLKFWKDEKLKEEDEPEMPSFAEKRLLKPNWPSSYALELVVLHAWSEANEPTDFDMTCALHAVLTSLVNHRQFRIVLEGQMEYNSDMLQPRFPPYIMDPVNPYNDMYHGLVDGQAFDWERVVPHARCWLNTSLFDGVSNTSKMW